VLKKSIFISLGLILFINTWSFSQAKKQIEYSGFFDSYYYRGPINITAGTCMAGYIGDLGFMPRAKISPGFNLGVSYKTWPKTYFGGEFNYYTLSGEKSDTSGKVSFNTTVYELIAFGRMNLLDRKILYKNDIDITPQRVRPYISIGVGAVYYDPKVTVTDTNFFKNYEAVKASSIALVVPVSLGFAFYISKRFSILTEFGYRYALTDAFDGLNTLGNSQMDSYTTASLKLQYTFHPFKKKRGKYVPLPEGYGAPSGGGGGSENDNSGTPAPKDSTLNAPILPPGEVAPAPTPEGQVAPTPPVEEKPKELTDEEKRKLEYEKEQSEWEQSTQPKKKTPETPPADNKKKAVEEPSGW